jgi:hypothetical protein
MDALTLREAAERTARSVTTLRRYIRSGRLEALKRPGRFGPEYFVSTQGLGEAGLAVDEESTRGLARAARAPLSPAPVRDAAPCGEGVPLALYQELQMKHEQLLVQYGMMRAAGLAALERQDELASGRRQLADAREELSRLKAEMARELGRLRGELQRAELEHEGLSLENTALREKVRGLEMLTRNARTSESIDHQFRVIMEQARRVERLASGTPDAGSLREQPPRPEPDP